MASAYPGALDSFTTKVNDVDDVLANDVNELQDGIKAVQAELGTDPAGTYATVKERLDDGNMATVHASTSKATPVDADELPLSDSAASNALKKLTWANLKATLKTYFDTLYLQLSGGTMTGAINMGGNGIIAHTATIADDAASSFVVGVSSHFAFLISCSFGIEYMWGRCNIFNGSTVSFVSHANFLTANNKQLTGTTGTDTKITVSFYVTDGKLYIENRTGGSRKIDVLILG
ncbi:MAG: hypothetical protein LC130_25690 [Bryobacterales bacterium]|nr:hypothetical protein [Bryobacterales bacterium]